MIQTPSRRLLLTVYFTLLASSFQALADRIPRAKETRPARIDLARTKPLASGGTAEIAFPKGEPRLGKVFDVLLCVKGSRVSAGAIALKAVMPEHAHGMVVVPEKQTSAVEAADSASCAVWKGARFHMPGWWRVSFIAGAGDQPPAVSFDFDIAHGR